ncbi:hypothetical protein STSP2_01228 [Anaerohalosphaera lusitana]|uniref:3-keto-alpha-glucoside-1,2-lyase/3-keto-2-hydroxy-glucal hydratase domain-containing protein n=1 Tax=Anaerohalosphaera lusitana TaxID=1936003 RepID=A0A1U9NJG2_9BACT|nr:DUF1080 domain-containing protein [Anaerohalosphaera lusitana]AQT68073.1 hypothetical protein STSP2_01228 [Anaerohalosphaera lusitana]
MRTLKMLFGMMVVLSAIAVGQAANPAVDRITEQMPANSSAMKDSLAVQLVGMTPESVEYLAGKLTPYDKGRPEAEYGISAMTDFIQDQKKDAIREDYAMLLADMIDDVPDKLGKAFLIEQLQLVGDEEVVDTVAGYLNDSFLCDFATRTLLTIGGDSVEAKLLAAFDTAYPENKLHLMQGLGEMQSMAGADKIQPYAASNNWKMRKAALQALANIGKTSSRGVLKNAVNVDDAYKKADNASLYLLFARRQAEQGKYDACARICNEVAGMFGDESHLSFAAADSMATAIGLDNVDKIKNVNLREKTEKQIRASLGADFVKSEHLAQEKDHVIKDLSEEEKQQGFELLFNGEDMTGWVGNKDSYGVKDGILFCRKGTGRNIYTEDTYDDFVMRFDFRLQPGTNNGLGIRSPATGDAAYVGMELQILDNTAEKYSNLKPYQYHGSVYGVIPAKRGYLNPVGEWNRQEVIADGHNIKVVLNGETILDGNIKKASEGGTIDGKDHPGLLNESGHIGFLGHGDFVEFKNIRIKEL